MNMSLKTELKQNIDKLTDSTAAHAVAGAGDRVAAKLREMQGRLTTADLQATLADVPQRLATVSEKAQAKLSTVPEKIAAMRAEPEAAKEAVRVKARELPERAQDLAVQVAGLAVQTYGELAERGRALIDRRRGTDQNAPQQPTAAIVDVAPRDEAAEPVKVADTQAETADSSKAADAGAVLPKQGTKAAGKPKATAASKRTAKAQSKAAAGKASAGKASAGKDAKAPKDA